MATSGRRECRGRKYAVAQRSLLVSKCTPGAKDTDHTVIPVAALAGCKVRGNGQMISAVECREHAVECRQMSERAPSPRVRDILIDMARSWERLALETEHSAPTSAKLVLRHQFEGSCRRRAIPFRMDRGGSEKKVADAGHHAAPTGRLAPAGASTESTIIQHAIKCPTFFSSRAAAGLSRPRRQSAPR